MRPKDSFLKFTKRKVERTMLKKITWIVFNAAVALLAVTTAVWLTITGHTLQIGGLLLAMGGFLGAVMFGFRLAEGYDGPGRLSIRAGRLRSVGVPVPALKQHSEFREAA
jgi:hypothetical protein